MIDVIVAGGGPVGWAAAVALREAGLDVVLLTPDREPSWLNNYGVWGDDAAAVGIADVTRYRFDAVGVHGRRAHHVARSYAIVDNAALADRMVSRGSRSRLRVVEGLVAGAHHDHEGTTVTVTAPWIVLRARLLVDATGRGLSAPAKPVARGWQSAYGVVVPVDRWPGNWESGASTAMPSFVLMDGRGSSDTEPPTFCYGYDRGDGSWFLEETVLTARTVVDSDVLKMRLRARLAAAHLDPTMLDKADQSTVEVVRIPMGGSVPPAGPIVRVGAAGGAINPATGYSLTVGLGQVPVMVSSMVAAFDRKATNRSTALAVNDAIWPPERRRGRLLTQMGHAALLSFDQANLQEFLDAFFDLSDEDRNAYQSGTAGGREVARVMTHLFRSASPSLRARLVTCFSPFSVSRASHGAG